MTFGETADVMRKAADAIDRVILQVGKDAETGMPKPMLEEDAACGAAALLCYIRDLVTVGNVENYDRGTLLVLLETISRDAEIFPCGVAKVLWAAEYEEQRSNTPG